MLPPSPKNQMNWNQLPQIYLQLTVANLNLRHKMRRRKITRKVRLLLTHQYSRQKTQYDDKLQRNIVQYHKVYKDVEVIKHMWRMPFIFFARLIILCQLCQYTTESSAKYTKKLQPMFEKYTH